MAHANNVRCAGILPTSTTENVLEPVHFEDLLLGGEWSTRRRTITSADLTAFVGLSGDYNPLYVDAEHARAGYFGQPVVPGTLLAAIAVGLGTIDAPVPATVGLLGMSWRFAQPVFLGDTIRTHWRLNVKRPVMNPQWGLVVWQVRVENQQGDIVATGEMTRVVARRELPVEVARPGKRSRRRRRASVETPLPVAPVTPKPIPGPLIEPGPRHAEEEPPAPVAAEAPSPSRRRRRSGRGQQAPPVEAPPPPETATEPLVAATPEARPELESPFRPPVPPAPVEPVEAPAEPKPRRRRSRAAKPAPQVEPAAADAQAPASDAAAAVVEEAAPAPRRRRSRSRTAPAPTPVARDGAEPAPPRPAPAEPAPPQATPPPPAPPVPTPAEPAGHAPAPEPPPPPPDDSSLANGAPGSGLASVFRRLRGS